MIKKDFAPWLKAFMEKNSLDHQTTARLAGVSVKTVYDWLKGRGPLHPDQTRVAILNADDTFIFDEKIEEIPRSERKALKRLEKQISTEHPVTLVHPPQSEQMIVVNRINSRPDLVPWVRGLLDVLMSGDTDSIIGIHANINAFLGDLKLPKVILPGRGKKQARDGG